MAAPEGKGYYIWKIPNCENGDIEQIAYTAYRARTEIRPGKDR